MAPGFHIPVVMMGIEAFRQKAAAMWKVWGPIIDIPITLHDRCPCCWATGKLSKHQMVHCSGPYNNKIYGEDRAACRKLKANLTNWVACPRCSLPAPMCAEARRRKTGWIEALEAGPEEEEGPVNLFDDAAKMSCLTTDFIKPACFAAFRDKSTRDKVHALLVAHLAPPSTAGDTAFFNWALLKEPKFHEVACARLVVYFHALCQVRGVLAEPS